MTASPSPTNPNPGHPAADTLRDDTLRDDTLRDDDLPAGFRFASTRCGIKPSGRPDLSLVVADGPITAAGVYTQNQIVAAPVILCRRNTPTDRFRAVVTNSGNANACTGAQGTRDAQRMADRVAGHLGCEPDQVLVMSTGVIGHPLPMDKVEKGIAAAAANLTADRQGFLDVAEAIQTTDRFTKIAHATIELSTGPTRIVATAKGAGMIDPDMATLLAMVMTDAALTTESAAGLIAEAADNSLNRISVDGHASTNDTLLLLASGQGDSLHGDDLTKLCQAVTELLGRLGRLIVADGEGATHFMNLQIGGAAGDEDAVKIARAIANSPLVKTAITGADPNWGRIVSAAGYAGPKIEVEKMSLSILGTKIFAAGTPVPYDAADLSRRMRESLEIAIELTVGSGDGASQFWASDLTKDYVALNSEYTT